MKKIFLIIMMMLIGGLAFAGTTQISPVSNGNQTVVMNDNFDSLQGGLNSLQGIFTGYFPSGVLGVANGGTGQTTPLVSIPSGFISMWGGSVVSIPTGYLLCNGASLLRTDYANLFSAIGTTYGYADSTHFYLPDLRDRFVMAAGGSYAVGATGDGTIPAHTHGFSIPTYSDPGFNQFGRGDSNTFSPYSGTTSSFGTGTKVIATYFALAYIIKT